MAIRRRARSEKARDSEQILPEAEMEVLAILEVRGDAEAKELVTRRKGENGKAFVYSASRPADPLFRGLVRRMVRRIFANDPARLVASLFDAKPPTREELRQIRELVEKMEKRRS